MRDLHVWQSALSSPWAIDEAKGRILLGVLAAHAAGLERATARGAREESENRSAARRSASSTVPVTIGVLPLHGVLMPRGDFLADGSGSTSLEGARKVFRSFVSDPGIEGVVLDIDSPGGQVFSVPEFAAEIRSAGKPVVAQVWDLAASAGYWLASAASELAVSPSGMVGSVGVYSLHQDASGWYEMQGIKNTVIQAGQYKTELSDMAPLTEEAKGYEQGIVDAYYTMFVRDVARGRKTSVSTVRDSYGQGRVVLAEDAVRLGMADRVGTFEETVAKLARDIKKKQRDLAQQQTLLSARRRADVEIELSRRGH